jgi:hypothetical protein
MLMNFRFKPSKSGAGNLCRSRATECRDEAAKAGDDMNRAAALAELASKWDDLAHDMDTARISTAALRIARF